MAITRVFAWPGSTAGGHDAAAGRRLARRHRVRTDATSEADTGGADVVGLGDWAGCRLAAGPDVGICTVGTTLCGEILAQPAGVLYG
jgi:hypothetical protein